MVAMERPLIAVGSCLATLFFQGAVLPMVKNTPITTRGRAKIRGDKAFLLTVHLDFKSAAPVAGLLSAWEKAANYCHQNEPFLYSYEVAQSDKNPLQYVITERYRSKEDYLGAHRRSSAFHEFRPQMRALQDAGEVTVTGDSFTELGVGFT